MSGLQMVCCLVQTLVGICSTFVPSLRIRYSTGDFLHLAILLPIFEPERQPHGTALCLVAEAGLVVSHALAQQDVQELVELATKHGRVTCARDLEERHEQQRSRFERDERRSEDEHEPAPTCARSEVGRHVGQGVGGARALRRR